ncbi:restriction endonuclease subunit S [Embleya sp. NPDC056575]|uniref:restriction endonuclease subunit S n=1 Tax=unclassified Embleya TaxID=2699296 RepID=UPI0036B9772D
MDNFPMVPLGELCEVSAGPSGTLFNDIGDHPNGVPIISPSDITDHQTVDARRVKRVSAEEAQQARRLSLRQGDLLVVRQGALGRVALIGYESTGWFYSSSCLMLRPKVEKILSEYLAGYLSHPSVREALSAQANPGTMPSLNASILKTFPVALPPVGHQHIVVETLADIDEQIAIQRKMTARLEALRPAVFTRLVPGGVSAWVH